MKIEQFFSEGYGERKLQFLLDLATIIIAKNTALTKIVPKPRKYRTDKEDPSTEDIKQPIIERSAERYSAEIPEQTSPPRVTYSIKQSTPEQKFESIGKFISSPDLTMIGSLLLDFKKVSENIRIGH